MDKLEKLYADYLLEEGKEDLLFVRTPEGNVVTFPGIDDTHVPITIEDTYSHKYYIVIFGN